MNQNVRQVYISHFMLITGHMFYIKLQGMECVITVKPVYSGHLGEIDKITTIYR